MTSCPDALNVGAYVLGGLDDLELATFTAHLQTCAGCRAEVADLQLVADTLPLAAPPVAPAPELRRRIMRIVESEAELLREAGVQAERPVVPVARAGRRRWWSPAPATRPATIVAAAVLLIGGVVGGVELGRRDRHDALTIPAQVAPAGATAALEIADGRGRLSVAHMPSPPEGRVYQVWLIRTGHPPEPTRTLFTVPADGRTTVAIQEALGLADAVWVTAEPPGGSAAPTSRPVIKAAFAPIKAASA
jgi:anti-sigma-K factor RskA